jgi:Arc/MetJ family transcription regulator
LLAAKSVVVYTMCMRTNIVLDDALVREAAELTGIRTKKALVHEALKALVASRKRRSLLDLRGKIHFAPGYDHRKLRRRREAT